jgi:hypothetical protein
MNSSDVDRLLARAQVGLAFLFSFGFFGVLFFLMLYHRELSPTELTTLTGLVSVLGTLLALQMNFFFARTRPAALPDPTTTSTTTTITTTPTPTVVPAGSTLVAAPSPPAAIVTTTPPQGPPHAQDPPTTPAPPAV